MKDHPILFSAPMVRALLDGSKTQTRRVVKGAEQWPANAVRAVMLETRGTAMAVDARRYSYGPEIKCPYGRIGDRLWVREAFDFLPAGGADQPNACEIVYWATGSTEARTAPIDYNPMIYGHEKVRPSIHMPRWASRITLEVTGVRVERLNDISEADAEAEGCEIEYDTPDGRGSQASYRRGYMNLWASINGPGSWDANPRVWVIEFTPTCERRKI